MVLYVALDDDGCLTSPSGVNMAEFPLEPMLAKMLLVSGKVTYLLQSSPQLPRKVQSCVGCCGLLGAACGLVVVRLRLARLRFGYGFTCGSVAWIVEVSPIVDRFVFYVSKQLNTGTVFIFRRVWLF